MTEEGGVTGYKWIYFLVAGFLLVFIFLYLYSAFAQYQEGKIECTDDIIDEIIVAKVLFAPCFIVYNPDLGRYIPGTIDMTKFTQETLDSCFYYLTKRVNITLEGTSIGVAIMEPKIINKTVWVVTDALQKPTTIQFMFEEPIC